MFGDDPGIILTKILATVGPACRETSVLVRLIEEGARVFRLNFSHGTFDDFAESVRAIRAAAGQANVPVGILGDLSGPKIRVGQVEGGRFELAVGEMVAFTRREGLTRRLPGRGESVMSVNYPQMIDEVKPGHRVFIDDGAVRMLVVERAWSEEDGDDRLHCRVTSGGPVSNRKGVNLPDSEITAPSLTEWDRQCAAWAVEHELDFVALSFVRKPEDLMELRRLLEGLTGGRGRLRMPIIAKIEKPQAVRALEAVIAASDGLMVARGDLGVEMDLAEVPVIQKRIITASHEQGKPVIVATQMLQSMVEDSTPTRAEVSDVANAIIDGADAVMLSGETAVGAYPVQAVRAMARVAATTEQWLAETQRDRVRPLKLPANRYRTAAIAHGLSVVAKDLGARWVVAWSELGGTARHLSQNRLPMPILVMSSNPAALRQMTLWFGVHPVSMPRPDSAEAFVEAADRLLCSTGRARPGDAVVFAVGVPIGTPGVLNGLRIHYLGDVCRLTWHAKG